MKKKIIIDTDPGIDDAIAILLAAAIKEYDILGITLVSGNVHADLGLFNLFRIFKEFQISFPVYKGTKEPLLRNLVEARETHGEDGLGNTNMDYEMYPYSTDGIDFIHRCLSENEEVTIFALGPLTNIAMALQKYPESFQNARVISMGGSFRSHGNCSPVAEYNYWVDPHGANYVLQNLPRPLEVVPLDVTRKFLFTPSLVSFMQRLDFQKGNFIKRITDFYMDFHWEYEGTLGAVINDPVTMIAERHPEFFRSHEYYCEVETESKAMGMLIVDSKDFYHKKPNVLLYEEIDEKEAMLFFLKEMFGEAPEIEAKKGSYLYEFHY